MSIAQYRRTVWFPTAGQRPAAIPLGPNIVADVAIIGAGFTGLTAALHLARRGAKVVILEADAVGAGAIGVTNFAESWHSDGSHAEHPPIGALLYALEVPPEGADTQFASMYLAYEALDEATKAKIDRLAAIHSYQKLQAALYPDKPLSEEVMRKTPDRHQAIVKTHPETGRRTLFLGDEIVTGVVGMPEPEGTELAKRLLAHATAERFVYTHKWKFGDLLFWDNRCTMHRVLPFDQKRYRRRVHRTTLSSVI
jgi:taurine dioxygenase